VDFRLKLPVTLKGLCKNGQARGQPVPSLLDGLSPQTLLDYRPLTLRNEKVRAIFKIEAEIVKAFRQYLDQQNFTEIHSSKLVSTGTEGGAQLFAVDYFGRQAYLAQSPQFYKQIMVGGFERVFEVGPVYRGA
jgi:nondiscriminating aspartyl-tRNA synthetase